MSTEPVSITVAIVTLVNAIVAGVLAWGVEISGEQQAAIQMVVTAVLGIVTVLVIRPRVTPWVAPEPKSVPPPDPNY